MAVLQARQEYLAQLANQPQPPAIQRRENQRQIERNGAIRRRLNFDNA